MRAAGRPVRSVFGLMQRLAHRILRRVTASDKIRTNFRESFSIEIQRNTSRTEVCLDAVDNS